MKPVVFCSAMLALAAFEAPAAPKGRVKALIVDGQNNHAWKETTPVLKKILEDSGLFAVDVATTPPYGADMSAFRPNFRAYKVIVSNYNGDPWPKQTQDAFAEYVRRGGGFVAIHAADNSFADWPEYNDMIGLGGWGNRRESAGPYLRFRDGVLVREQKTGPGGHHGKQHAFVVTIRDASHPVTKGLPETWMHAQDELYDSLRGRGRNLTLLATAYSDPATGGSGEHEPMLMAIAFGKGRIFHTTLGHNVQAMRCVGFIVTLRRGTEWAATGKASQKVPADFPSARQVSLSE